MKNTNVYKVYFEDLGKLLKEEESYKAINRKFMIIRPPIWVQFLFAWLLLPVFIGVLLQTGSILESLDRSSIFLLLVIFFLLGFRYFTWIEIDNQTLTVRNFWKRKTFKLDEISGTSVIPLYKYAPPLGNQLKIHLKNGLIPDSEMLINMNIYSSKSIEEIRAIIERKNETSSHRPRY